MQSRKLGKQNRSYTQNTANLIKKAEANAKEFIEQEALETLETEKDCYYKCEFYLVVTRRQRMIHCSHCKK